MGFYIRNQWQENTKENWFFVLLGVGAEDSTFYVCIFNVTFGFEFGGARHV